MLDFTLFYSFLADFTNWMRWIAGKCWFFFFWVCLFVCLSVYLFVCLYVCLLVCFVLYWGLTLLNYLTQPDTPCSISRSVRKIRIKGRPSITKSGSSITTLLLLLRINNSPIILPFPHGAQLLVLALNFRLNKELEQEKQKIMMSKTARTSTRLGTYEGHSSGDIWCLLHLFVCVFAL